MVPCGNSLLGVDIDCYEKLLMITSSQYFALHTTAGEAGMDQSAKWALVTNQNSLPDGGKWWEHKPGRIAETIYNVITAHNAPSQPKSSLCTKCVLWLFTEMAPTRQVRFISILHTHDFHSTTVTCSTCGETTSSLHTESKQLQAC